MSRHFSLQLQRLKDKTNNSTEFEGILCFITKKVVYEYMTDHIQFNWHNSSLQFFLNTRLLCKASHDKKWPKHPANKYCSFKKSTMCLFFSLRQKIYLTLNCVISTFVSCYLGNPESIIMILHEPDVALQNWYAFILFLSHTQNCPSLLI